METESTPKIEKPPPLPVEIPESETENASPVVIASQPIGKPGKSSKKYEKKSLKPTLKPVHQNETNSPAPIRLSLTPAELVARKLSLTPLNLIEKSPRKSPKIQAKIVSLNQTNRARNNTKIKSISEHNPLVILKPCKKDLETYNNNSKNCVMATESVFKNDEIFEEITAKRNSSDSEDSYESVVFVGDLQSMRESKIYNGDDEKMKRNADKIIPHPCPSEIICNYQSGKEKSLIENIPHEICDKIANFEKLIKSNPRKQMISNTPQISTKYRVSSNVSLKSYGLEQVEVSTKKRDENNTWFVKKTDSVKTGRNEPIKCLLHDKHERLLDASIPAMFVVPKMETFEEVAEKSSRVNLAHHKEHFVCNSAQFQVNEDVFKKKTLHLSARCEKSPEVSPSKRLFETSLFQKGKSTKTSEHPQKLSLLQDIYKEDDISMRSFTFNESIIEVKLTPKENSKEPNKKCSKITEKIKKLSPLKKQKHPRVISPSPIPQTARKIASTRNFPNRKFTAGQNINWTRNNTSLNYIEKFINVSSDFLSKFDKNIDNRAGEFV